MLKVNRDTQEEFYENLGSIASNLVDYNLRGGGQGSLPKYEYVERTFIMSEEVADYLVDEMGLGYQSQTRKTKDAFEEFQGGLTEYDGYIKAPGAYSKRI